jgi:hypothetical protein
MYETIIAFARVLLKIVASKPNGIFEILAGIALPLFLDLKRKLSTNLFYVFFALALPTLQFILMTAWLARNGNRDGLTMSAAVQEILATILIGAICIYGTIILTVKYFINRNTAMRKVEKIQPSTHQNRITRDN